MTPEDQLRQFLDQHPEMINYQRYIEENMRKLTTSEARLIWLQEEMLDNCERLKKMSAQLSEDCVRLVNQLERIKNHDNT